MFYGKPVVAFRVGGIPEVIGDSCSLYPFGDVTAAAAGFGYAGPNLRIWRAKWVNCPVAIVHSKSSQQIAFSPSMRSSTDV